MCVFTATQLEANPSGQLVYGINLLSPGPTIKAVFFDLKRKLI